MRSLLLSIFLFMGIVSSTLVADTVSTPDDRMTVSQDVGHSPKSLTAMLGDFIETTGLYAMLNPKDGALNGDGKEISRFAQGLGRVIMFIVVFILFYLAIAKNFEPLLLIPIGFGGLLANIPIANMTAPHGMLGIIYNMGIANEFFPLLILWVLEL